LRDLGSKICLEYKDLFLTLEDVLAALDDLEPQQLEVVTRTEMRSALRKYKRFL
jgi:hypothetical protein